MNSKTAWISLFGLVFHLLVLNDSVLGDEGLSGHVTLTNGDEIPVRITSFDGDRIAFSSSLFAESIELKTRFISSFGFHAKAEAKKSKEDAAFTLAFKDGSQLQGILVSLSDEVCVLRSDAVGEVRIPCTELLELKRVQNEPGWKFYSALAPEWLDNEWLDNEWLDNEWLDNESLDDQRVDALGHIIIEKGLAEPVVIPDWLDGAGRWELEFEVDGATEFQVQLIAENHKAVTSIGISNSALILESGDQLEFGELRSIRGIAKLSLNWSEGSLSVLDRFGRLVSQVSVGKASPLALSIKNDGSPLKVRGISVAPRGEQALSDDFSPKAWLLQCRDATIQQPSRVRAQDDVVLLEDADGEEVEIPLCEVERLWFGAKYDDPAGAESAGRGRYTCLWPNGLRMHCDDIVADSQGLTYDALGFDSKESRMKIPPTKVFVGSTEKGQPGDRFDSSATERRAEADAYRLMIGGIPFSGSYAWGDSRQPIRWQFYGFLEPVTLNIERKIEISRVQGTQSGLSAESPDRVMLKDGSIVPCRIDSSDGTELRLGSAQVEATQVPMGEVRCCFFDTTDLEWRKALTNESVARTLTLPRFSEDAHFSHVLVGKNGDLLRGHLLAIHADEIEFESRFEALRIPKENVVGVVFVDADSAESADDVSGEFAPINDAAQVDVQPVVAHVDCGHDFVAVGRYVSLNDEEAILESSVLGRMTLSSEQIRRMAFNAQLEGASVLQDFSDWQRHAPIEPRWEDELSFAADANKLMDQPAPDFDIPQLGESRSFQLSDHLGKVVIIDFWETSSRPSVLGISDYLNVFRKFSPADVEFVAVNQGETASSLNKFLATTDWGPFKVALDYQMEVSKSFNVSGIPHLTIVDQRGVIRYIKVGYSSSSAESLEARIRELLKE